MRPHRRPNPAKSPEMTDNARPCESAEPPATAGGGAPARGRVRFLTIGCRLNQAEEAAFASMFERRGWSVVRDDAECDVVILHSCAVTRQAERTTLQAARASKRGKGSRVPYLIVTGCATSALEQGALSDAGADVAVPKGDYARLCEIAESLLASGRPPSAPPATEAHGEFPAGGRAVVARAVPNPTAGGAAFWGDGAAGPRPGHSRAMLKVQDGCDFRCAYCIVPFTRGGAVSRPWGDALAAARGLAAAGAPEIVLTGCNLACYAWMGRTLPELVSAVCEEVGPLGVTVSLGSVEPGICDDGIIAAFGRHRNLRHFVHLPVQSGDSEVLRRAGRRYDEARIREILSAYRESCDDLFLGGDFITGLPGETEEAFGRTCALARDFAFDRAHVFPYSPRQGTRALADNDTPSRAVAKERAARLRAICGAAAQDRV